ncbi:MAG: FIST C-terminal domain-containing protein [Spirochaetaceae bacterium]|jgi:hypothetical protein|nr:FIST C-terminal domain-containing protein [Spirochaetaceae bacterium]
MITTKTAWTTEIDDVDAAVRSLLEQLDIEHSLLAHSVGVLTCFRDFISGGVVKALCDALPFDVVGCGCIGSACQDTAGEMLLVLTVFSSDDVVFHAGVSESLSGGGNPFTDAYTKACANLPDPPALILLYSPHLSGIGNDKTLGLFSEAAPGVPIFGTISSSFEFQTDKYSTPVVFNREVYDDNAGFIVLSGNVHPEFYITALAPQNTQKSKAVITKTNGTRVLEINNKSPLLWLRDAGIDDDSFATLASFPVVVDYRDGTPPVPHAFLIDPNGHLISSLYIYEGVGVSLGEMTDKDVMTTSAALVKEIASRSTGKSFVFMHSCLSRLFVLGVDTTAELELVRSSLAGTVPFHICYSGGEICPIRKESGEEINRLHNFSFVACTL